MTHAMYDVHFKFSKEKQRELLAADKPLEAHFRVYSIAEEAGRQMLDRSIWDPKLKLPAAGRDAALRREQIRKLRDGNPAAFGGEINERGMLVLDRVPKPEFRLRKS